MAEIASGPEAIAQAVRRLSRGELVAFPTETVYGLGALALNAAAVEKVFAFKGRPGTNPLIVHVAGVAMARTLVADWPANAEALAKAFWPGPLTIVLPKAPAVPDAVCAAGPTVGVRCPGHPCALALIEALAAPIVGPSANPSGLLSPTTPEHVRNTFTDTDLLIIDGGHCRAGIESTVVDLSTDEPTILRPGVIGPHAIAQVLAREVRVLGTAADAGAARSPGLIGAHYQPRTPTRIAEARELAGASPDAALLSWSLGAHPQAGPLIVMPRDHRAFAASLYRALHEADRAGASQIWVEQPPPATDKDDEAIRDAVMERLSRATHR